MTVLMAATIVLSSTVSSDAILVGSAAHYAPSYDNGGWERIIAAHRQWGQIDDTFVYSPDGFYCVQPDYDFGDRLHVMNAMTGEHIVCTVADAVAPRDEPHWRANAVVELSWAAFVAVGATEHNEVVVWMETG